MKYFINALLFLAISSLYAQHTISGTITDKTSGESLVYASVYFPELEKGSSTDESGNYEINNIPSGSFKIIISSIGYETHSAQIDIHHSMIYDNTLSTSAIEMEEVIISTPFHKLQSENVMKVEQKKISELKASGATTLAEGITSIPGVESVSTGISIGKPVIRGLSSNRVLVYTQGIRLENQQFGGEHGLGLNDAGIESIEVIKGPASLLYGSDALGGVLYINPERFANENTSSGDANVNYYTNTQGYSTNLGYKASASEFKFIFRGSLAEHSDYKTQDYRVTNTRFREQDFKAGIGYQISNFKTEFRYNLNASQLGLPDGIGVQELEKTPMLPNQRINNHVFSSKSTWFLNESSLDVSLGFIYNDRKEFEDHHHEDDHDDDDDDDDDHEEEEEEEEDLEPALHMKLKTFNYDVKYNLPKLGKFETIVGIQGMNQQNGNYGEEQLIPDATTNDFGILATSHIHFETVDVQLGARFDNRNINVIGGLQRNFNSFNGAIGAKTNLFSNITTRLNLASGYRAPNLAELTSDGSHEGTNRYEIGNPDLDNEQNIQIDLALEFKNEHIEVFANGFYNTIKNYIYLSPDGSIIDEQPVYLYQQDDANLYGGEFGLHFHPHPLDWLHFESSFETVIGKQNNDDYLPLIPANTWNNTIRVEFDTTTFQAMNAFIKLSTAFDQNNVSQFETTSEGYSLLSVGLAFTVDAFNNPLRVTLSGNNLADIKYINHLSRLKTDNIYNIGRNFNFGLTYSL
ncbi:MAG: TonB-dependent receptor [Flavobacteriaceae bacterium]|nr:TonB-dependent receptor [Flavobacteriaceae bacterium]